MILVAVTGDHDIGLYNGLIVIRIQLNITRGNVDFHIPLVFRIYSLKSDPRIRSIS